MWTSPPARPGTIRATATRRPTGFSPSLTRDGRMPEFHPRLCLRTPFHHGGVYSSRVLSDGADYTDILRDGTHKLADAASSATRFGKQRAGIVDLGRRRRARMRRSIFTIAGYRHRRRQKRPWKPGQPFRARRVRHRQPRGPPGRGAVRRTPDRTVDIPVRNGTLIRTVNAAGITPEIWLVPTDGGNGTFPQTLTVSHERATVVFPYNTTVSGLGDLSGIIISASANTPSEEFRVGEPRL